METISFEVIGGSAKDILQHLAHDHTVSIKELDAITEEFHLTDCKVLVTDNGKVAGFDSGEPPLEWLQANPACIFDGKLTVPNMEHPYGVALSERLDALKLPSKTSVTKAFGGEPFVEDGQMHFVSLRFLGKPILTVPKKMKITLPDGLQPIQHLVINDHP